MLQYTNFKLALLAAADTEPGTVYSHPFEEGPTSSQRRLPRNSGW
jgi:hypothetical protein